MHCTQCKAALLQVQRLRLWREKLATDLRGINWSIIWGIFFWFNFNLYIKVIQKTTFLKLEHPQTDFPIVWVNIRLGHTSLFFYQKWHLVVAPAISIRYQIQKKILDLKKLSKKIRKKSLILTVYNTWVKDFRKWDKNVKISYFWPISWNLWPMCYIAWNQWFFTDFLKQKS